MSGSPPPIQSYEAPKNGVDLDACFKRNLQTTQKKMRSRLEELADDSDYSIMPELLQEVGEDYLKLIAQKVKLSIERSQLEIASGFYNRTDAKPPAFSEPIEIHRFSGEKKQSAQQLEAALVATEKQLIQLNQDMLDKLGESPKFQAFATKMKSQSLVEFSEGDNKPNMFLLSRAIECAKKAAHEYFLQDERMAQDMRLATMFVLPSAIVPKKVPNRG